MVTIGEQGVTCSDIPDLYSTIIAGRGNILTVGRPCNCIYLTGMTAISQEGVSRRVYELVVGRDRQREKKGVSSSVRRGGFEPRRKIEKQREVPQMETNER